MKKNAWTLAEMMIAMVILIILCSASMTIMKGINTNKARIYLYSAMKSFGQAHGVILERYGSFSPAEDTDSATNIDWYCINAADVYSLARNPVCNTTTSANTPNLYLPNGIALYGLSSSWTKGWSDDAPFEYKNIMVDINDGNGEGPNKVGVDRFPFRLYRGKTVTGINLDGMVYSVNCRNDKYTKSDGTTVNASVSSPYCNSSNIDFNSDDEILTYDIYRKETKESEYAKIMLANRSLKEADCKAYGGTGFFTQQECNSAGYKLLPKCAKQDLCDLMEVEADKTACESAIATNNAEEQSCFSIIKL